MPEGHTIHRYARKHRVALGGEIVAASSPQGRFSGGAARINGRTLEDVEAHGKHLFYRWDSGEILHVHLGLFGKFRTYQGEPPQPTAGTRLAMSGGEVTLHLAGPTICDLIDPETEASIRSRLGPDPLMKGGPDNNSERFADNLSRRRIPIGAALLDQHVIAGIGNVYRAEALFLTGIDPHLPANEIRRADTDRLWETNVELLTRGERAGRIVTVEPAEVGARTRSELGSDERLYAYQRHGQPCRRCGTPIALGELSNRKIWWCPTCQKSS